MYETLPDAIRFVNPAWDFLGSGKRLWPFFFYWFGLAEPGADEGEEHVQEESVTEVEDSEEREDGEGEDEVDDDIIIWTL